MYLVAILTGGGDFLYNNMHFLNDNVCIYRNNLKALKYPYNFTRLH